MKTCECCGYVSMLLRQEQRGSFGVDVYWCRTCGEWEDYRITQTRILTTEQVQARINHVLEHSRQQYRERIKTPTFRALRRQYAARYRQKCKAARVQQKVEA